VRSWALFAATLLLLFGAAALFVSILARRMEGPLAESVPGESLYREVMARVVRDHVDPIDEEGAVYGAVKGLAAELDPHSRVYAPAEWAEFQRETRGEATGIGIEIAVLDRALIVAWVAPDGPAGRAGIRAGERILGLSGGPDDSDRAALLRAIRGAAGTRLDLALGDRDGANRRVVTLTRVTFDVPTVHARTLPGGILYARVTAFRPHTADSFARAIAEARTAALAGVVLDLRFNRGGSFDPAVAMADAWLSEGVIVKTRGPNRDDVVRADAAAPLAGTPTVVLVNGTTASAAEVVAGALQDTQSALLVGERTFGKGVVQEVFEFQSWPGGMKLTTARYFTPAGRCIDRGLGGGRDGAAPSRGLLPDVVVEVPAASAPALERALEREAWPDWLRSALAERDGGPAPGDLQLEAALAILSGRTPDRRTHDDAGIDTRPR
jgi:carboxyl-terminal processing protease